MWTFIALSVVVAIVYAARQRTTPRPTTTGELPGGPAPQCLVTRRDGPYAICLTRLIRTDGTVWRWTASQVDVLLSDLEPPPDPIVGQIQAPSEEEALADAWVDLAKIDVGATVVPADVKRQGVTLTEDGDLVLGPSPGDLSAWLVWASPRISAAAQAGDDAAGIVITLLTDLYGKDWNPLRVHQGSRDFQTIVDAAAATGANPPQFARSMVGAVQ